LIKVYGREVYDTDDEIIAQLQCRSYYNAFLAKITIYETEFDDSRYGKWSTKMHDMSWRDADFWKWKKDHTYIISIYNTHHQQMLNPVILAVHFDCTDKELITAMDPGQLYSGAAGGTYCDETVYSENGQVLEEREKDGTLLVEYEYDDTGYTTTDKKYNLGTQCEIMRHNYKKLEEST
jgi:hypothetical protein